MKKNFIKLTKDLIPDPLLRIAQHVQAYTRRMQAERAVAVFRKKEGKPHGLPGELIVSLTSYPPRYHCLAKTILSLLMQDMRPDRIVLWLAEGPENAPPPDVLDLQSKGLEIRYCDDIRSYKKIIYSLQNFPNSFIVTADDDLYYEDKWLRTIVSGFDDKFPTIVCRRAHRPKLRDSQLAPYEEWDQDVICDDIEHCIFPTTGAGALFPPNSLAPDVTERSIFLELCPYADDVWLFVMALRAGSRFKQVGGGFPQITWEKSQATSLLQHNLGERGNDRQLSAVISRYCEDPLIQAALASLHSKDA